VSTEMCLMCLHPVVSKVVVSRMCHLDSTSCVNLAHPGVLSKFVRVRLHSKSNSSGLVSVRVRQ
jgi:hypothetical protein